MTRAEAIAYLRSQGVHAHERDWAMGETIMVAAGVGEHGGIRFYSKAVFIAPEDGGWSCYDMNRPRERIAGLSLQAACDAALAALRAGPDA